jgi:hypothetical protein
MLYYAVYDLKTGRILHTHSRVDVEGKHLEVPEAHILSLINPSVDRTTIGIAPVEISKELAPRGGSYRIDPTTRRPIFYSPGSANLEK